MPCVLASVSLRPTRGEFGVREHAERNLPARRHAVPTIEVVTHYPEIVDANVGKLRTSCHLADGPNAGRGCLQAFVDLHVSAICQFDARQLQANSVCVWNAARCNQQVTALHHALRSILFEGDSYGLARFSGHPFKLRIQNDIDALVLEKAAKSF